jgi:serine/threonine-protein kinase GIN4
MTEVLEEATESFASAAAPKELPLPPLPPPLSRNTPANKSTRLPRRVLAASQIFQSDEHGNITAMVDQSMASSNSGFLTANDILVSSTPAPTAATKGTTLTGPEERVERKNQFQIPEINTPSRQKRRATVSISSPAAKRPEGLPCSDDTSARKEKSKSQSNLLDMHIVPISVLEAEMNKSMFCLTWFYYVIIDTRFPSSTTSTTHTSPLTGY